ncbi:MAG: T9SS type A sorting domain-containing protein [Bacteroidetes bacterium]|nr:T9SS type A sorting domain-containing protein [Bacteroidota bacterium]
MQTENIFTNATLTINNHLGQTVKQIENISGQSITLFRDNLQSGLYFIHLTQDNKTIATDKLVIAD